MPYPLLTDITVAEIATSIAGRFAGRLLADLGANVIAIEAMADGKDHRPPADGTAAARIDSYLAANKQRAQFDLSPANLEQIRRRADIVIYDRSLTDDRVLLDSTLDAPGVVAVVTPYGLKGPYTYLHEDELFIFALSGIAIGNPANATDRAYERPMQGYGHQAACLGGVVTAVAALQEWFAARRTGCGRILDISTVDALGSTLGGEVLIPQARSSAHVTPRAILRDMFSCQDGYVYVSGGECGEWAEILGIPRWLEAPFNDLTYCLQHWDEIMADAREAFRHRRTSEIFSAAQAAGLVAYPVNSTEQVVAQTHFQARGVFEPLLTFDKKDSFVAPRTPIRFYDGRGPNRTPDVVRPRGIDTESARARLLSPAPQPPVDGAKDSRLPLEGVRIADFSWVIAGPHCTKWAGSLGAEVIKVESQHRPDPARKPGHFPNLNYSKKTCAINLGKPEGRKLATQLSLASDVVIENYSTGAAERMGIDFAELVKQNPKLVMISSSGMGRTGPDALLRAYGTPIQAYSGHTYLASWPGTPPRGQGLSWTDPVTGEMALLAMLAGLAYSQRTGTGVHFDLSMAEVTIALMFEAFLEQEPKPRGNHVSDCSPHNTYRCTDGWIAIAAHTDAEWQSLSRLIDRPCLSNLSLSDRLKQTDQIDAAIDGWCRSKARNEALRSLAEAGVCTVPVTELDDIGSLEHYNARDLVFQLETPDAGTHNGFKLPWVTQGYPKPVYGAVPRMGQDNDYVFEQVLGLSSKDIAELSARDVLT